MFNEQENYDTCFLVLRLSQPTITLFPEAWTQLHNTLSPNQWTYKYTNDLRVKENQSI